HDRVCALKRSPHTDQSRNDSGVSPLELGSKVSIMAGIDGSDGGSVVSSLVSSVLVSSGPASGDDSSLVWSGHGAVAVSGHAPASGSGPLSVPVSVSVAVSVSLSVSGSETVPASGLGSALVVSSTLDTSSVS